MNVPRPGLGSSLTFIPLTPQLPGAATHSLLAFPALSIYLLTFWVMIQV